MKERLLGAALASTLAVGGLAGCASIEGIEGAVATPSPNIATWLMQNRDAPHLLGSTALNLIFEEPVTQVPGPTKDYYAGQKTTIASELVHSDPGLVHSIQSVFTHATYGRYHPRTVSITVVPKKLDIGCVSGSPEQDSEIQVTAEPYNKPGELNVIAIDQESCVDADLGGYYTDGDTDGVVTRSNFVEDGNAFALTGVHEGLGHDEGLLHAGQAICYKPATIDDCALNPVADTGSVMGYEDGSVFTYPELDAIGLLRPDEEQLVTKPGTYTLSTIDHDGIKVLVLPPNKDSIPNGKEYWPLENNPPVYISFEPAPSAAYDIKCKLDPDDSEDGPKFLYEAVVKGKNYACREINQRSLRDSVQVRTPLHASASDSKWGDQDFMANIIDNQPRLTDGIDYDALLEADPTYNPFNPTQTEDGYIRPGQVIYQNDFETVRIGEVTDGQATLLVTANKAAQ